MSDYLEVTIDVFDEAGQRAAVLRTLPVRGLIDEVVREFDGLEKSAAQSYAVYLKEGNRLLDPNQTLAEQGVADHDELVFGWVQAARAPGRLVISSSRTAVLREEQSGMVFPIEWQPAVIGRPHSDPALNRLLAVDVSPLPNSRRVSRRHAQITERDGQYFLESLSPHNPTYMDGAPVTGKRPLQPGSRIHLGGSSIALVFQYQT